MNSYGYNPPFFGGHQNVMSKQSGERLIKNDILQLLLTMPSERVMRPNWGTPIKSSLFQNADEETANDLASAIQAKVNRWEPRVRVSTSVNIEGNTMRVRLEGIYTNEPNRTFEQEVNLSLIDEVPK